MRTVTVTTSYEQSSSQPLRPKPKRSFCGCGMKTVQCVILLAFSSVIILQNSQNLDKQQLNNIQEPEAGFSKQDIPNTKQRRGDIHSTTRTVKDINAPTKPVEKIILLGERHSGTNWITHLIECFQDDHVKVTNEYKRFKHWFQEEDLQRVPENSAVVVAMFRDPYMWVEAMRVEPHHAHNHIIMPQPIENPEEGWKTRERPMGWEEFVTKPWIGSTKRGPRDINITNTPGGKESVMCHNRYSFVDVSPCSPDDLKKLVGLGDSFYELQHDGSERAYSSVIDLRRDKIINHLSVADFLGTRAFLPMRYEDLNANGTSILLRSIEEATGLKANCSATFGKGRRRLVEKPITKHAKLSDEFVEWMNSLLTGKLRAESDTITGIDLLLLCINV